LRDIVPELADVSVVDAPHGAGAFREMLLHRRDGAPLHADVTVTPLRHDVGGEPLYLAVLHDVTARRRSEQDLRRRLDELQAFYDLSEAATSGLALESVYSQALSGLVRALGTERASLLLLDEDGVMRFKAWRGLS